MQLRIKIIAVEVVKSAKFSMAEVTFKNMDLDKTESRKIPSFKNPEVFNTLSKALAGQEFTVSIIKDGQYWVWEKLESGASGAAPAAATTTGYTSPKSTYETPEERAKKQVYITRLSCLSTAVATLQVGAKSPPKTSEVVAVAKQYSDYVFGSDAMSDIANMSNDLPGDIDLGN